MDTLSQYYRGITQQLRSEVDCINTLFTHQGLKGEGNETLLRDLLTRFIPKRFGVGTGIVIDRIGKQSRQCDIVVYDTHMYPSLLSLSSIHIFPVDLVYATIEVKTTLDSGSANEAQENIDSVKKLDYIQGEHGYLQSEGAVASLQRFKTFPPLGFVFAYNSDCKTDSTFKSWFTPTENSRIPYLPNIVCALDMGMVYHLTVPIPEGSSPVCATFPVVRPSGVDTDQIEYLWVEAGADMVPFEGGVYPVKKVGANYVAIDQSRVLLNFILLFNEMLGIKRHDPAINFRNTYLTDLDRYHFTL